MPVTANDILGVNISCQGLVTEREYS